MLEQNLLPRASPTLFHGAEGTGANLPSGKGANWMPETHSRPLTGHDAYGVPWREWSQGNCTTIGQKVDDEVSCFSNLNKDL
jgi:hypothetical protein